MLTQKLFLAFYCVMFVFSSFACQQSSAVTQSMPVQSMKFYDFFPELLKEDPTGTELYVYQMLKENPRGASVNVLVVPWHALVTNKQLHKAEDALEKTHVNGGFTVSCFLHDSDGDRILTLLKKVGIDTVFTPDASTHLTQREGISIYPLAYLALNSVPPARNKDIFYSFIGFASHLVRKRIFSMTHPANTIVKETSAWKGGGSSAQDFKAILSRSRFALCPRGWETNSIRLFEALSAGAIPVLISDDVRLPEGFEWKRCIIRVQEDALEQIPHILSGITQEKEQQMRQDCEEAYKCFSGKNLLRVIYEHYKVNYE